MPAQAWVALVVGGLATIGVIVTWQQKNRADRRSEWWRRTTWAFERTFSGDDTQAFLGWRMLKVLAGSKLATKDDSAFVLVIAQHAVKATETDTSGEDEDGEADQPDSAETEAQP